MQTFTCNICGMETETKFQQFNDLFGAVCSICYFAYLPKKPVSKQRTSNAERRERINRVFGGKCKHGIKQIVMRNGVRLERIY